MIATKTRLIEVLSSHMEAGWESSDKSHFIVEELLPLLSDEQINRLLENQGVYVNEDGSVEYAE